MKRQKLLFAAVALCLTAILLFSACSFLPFSRNREAGDGESALSAEATGFESAFADLSEMKMSFSDRDGDASYDPAEATKINFGTGIAITGNGATSDDKAVTITAAGVYILSGKSENGSVTVSLPKNDKAQLVLDGLDLTCKNGPALRIISGDKVFITLAKGSENALADGDDYQLEQNGSTLDGAIFSKSDLAINGTGALTVNGNYKHGVVSKDDLVVAGGTITVTAKNVALSGKDCVKIKDAVLDLTAGTDGIRSDNDEDESRGFVYIESGTFSITAGNDGIQAETVLKIDGGDFTVTTGGGSKAVSSTGRGLSDRNGDRSGGSASSDESAKGLKAGRDLIVENGTFTLDTADDCLHANDSIALKNGGFLLSSGDDGVHADNALVISGGELVVTRSYEGLEANDVYVSGGKLSITASDDGINAAGGNDSSSVNGRPGMGGFADVSDSSITLAGGYLVIDADGDGLDSNGTVLVTGGVTLISGPTNNGNSAFDYGKSAYVTGGTLVALGSSGMAVGFTNAENQGAILVNFNTQKGGTSLALRDKSGRAVVAYTGTKQYQSAVITAPGIRKGETYTLIVGGAVAGADENGYAEDASLSGGTEIATVEMADLVYGSSSGFGGFPGGGQGGFPGGDFPGRNGGQDGQNGFPGQDGQNSAPSLPDGTVPTPPDGQELPDGVPSLPDGSGQGGRRDGTMTPPNGGNGQMPSPSMP